MVVTVGVTFTGVPLVTAPTLLLTLPVPPVNIAVNVVDFPAVIVAAPDKKLVTAGAGNTVTVRPLLVALNPCASVTLIVSVWLAPAVVGGHLHSVWIYLLAPVLGAILAVPACCAFRETGCCSPSGSAGTGR